ncbi:hypothetical protein HYS48_02340 [Candidatus Woesearchaeota archaeon]|nr:hypothetical protein [Candidatus Woesearchaeota archaeon]
MALHKKQRERAWGTQASWLLLALLLLISSFILTRNLTLPALEILAERDVVFPGQSNGIADLKQPIVIPKYQNLDQKLVEEKAKEYKASFQDPLGQAYLGEIDTYNYYRQAQNILRYGHVGNLKKYTVHGEEIWDTVKNAPVGITLQPSLLPYVLVGIYQTIRLLNADATLITAATYYPVFFALLSIVLVFLITKKLSNTLGGFLAAVFLSFHPLFFRFHYAGLADTNALNIFFSLLIVYFFMLFLDSLGQQRRGKTIVSALALLLSIALFRFTWGGYFYILVILFAFTVLSVAFLLVQNYKKTKSKRSLGLLMTILILFSFLLWRMKTSILFQKAMAYLQYGSTILTPLPLFISELKPLEWKTIFLALGGLPMMILLFLSLVLVLYRNRTLQKHTKYDLLILVWILTLLYPATKIRFLPFLIPPLAILLGVGSSLLLLLLLDTWGNSVKKKQLLYYGIAMLLVVIILFSLIPLLRAEMLVTIPIMDDSIYNTALKIKQESPEQAIVNVWWDSGYFYEAIAEKPVLFDGASFDSKKTYWMSRVFTETDEDVAIGILRMLDCRGEDSIQKLIERMGYRQAMEERDFLFRANRTAVRVTIAMKNFPIFDDPSHTLPSWQHYPVSKELFLNALYCTPPESFLVVSEDLLEKYWVFAYYSQWDFVQDPATIPLQKDWITEAKNAEEIIGMLPMQASSNGTIFYYDGKQVFKERPEQGDFWAGILFQDHGKWKYVLMKPEMLDSLFVKLFFLNGNGLQRFEKFSDISGRYTKKVVAYKIDWKAD